jgi:thymidylate synthase
LQDFGWLRRRQLQPSLSRVALGRARRDEQMVTGGCRSCAGRLVDTVGAICIQLQNHLEQVKVQLSRECRSLPRMKLNPAAKNIDYFKFEDFELLDYDLYPSIKAEIAVYVSF